MVQVEGVEPSWSRLRGILSPVRLPFRHTCLRRKLHFISTFAFRQKFYHSFVCSFFPKMTSIFGSPDSSALHFDFCLMSKVLPFACFFAYPKNSKYFWEPYCECTSFRLLSNAKSLTIRLFAPFSQKWQAFSGALIVLHSISTFA